MAWRATLAEARKALGVCTVAACDADDARLREPSPLHLEAVRGRILLDEERGPPEDRGELLQDPRRDLEALPRVVDAHEVLRHPMADLEIAHQRFQIGSLEDPLHEGPVLRHDVPGPRDILRAPLDPRPELPTVLVAARAVMDRRLPASLEDPQRDGVRPLDAVGELVLHLVSVDLHPRERSEERRVGKECRSRASPDYLQK